MANELHVSVIIPTYNREEVLCDAIRGALEQDYPRYEVLVIDQTVEHAPETEAFLRDLPENVRVIRQDAPSLPLARNRGIDEAQGEILLFIDDDVTFGPDLISQHARHYEDPDVGAVAGRIRQDSRYVHPPSLRHDEFVQWFSPDKFDMDLMCEAERINGGNSSVRRSLAIEAGRFDPGFRETSFGEEIDFSIRLRKLGCRIIYDPDASVFHLNAPTGGCQNRRRFHVPSIFNSARNLTYLVEKNDLPRRYYPYLLWFLYRRTLPKKDYLSPRGLVFFSFGHLVMGRGLIRGFVDGRRKRRDSEA